MYMITKDGERWILKSKDGSKHLGTFSSKEAALERERQIEYFKKQPTKTKARD